LATAELIAILLGTGQGKGKLSAVGLGQYILNQLSQHQRDPLAVLRNISVQELTQIHGIGPAKATGILAAVELGKRVFQSRPPELAVVDSPPIGRGCPESGFDVAVSGTFLLWCCWM
jgi:DNA replication and repair protein RadC